MFWTDTTPSVDSYITDRLNNHEHAYILHDSLSQGRGRGIGPNEH